MTDDYQHEPVACTDCGECVVVTRPADPQQADDAVRFECGCAVGVIGAVKPESWTGGAFL